MGYDTHYSDDEENEVSDLEPSYDELHNAFLELHGKCLKLSRTCSKQKKIILSLESKANDMQLELHHVKNSTCNKCKTLESNVFQ